MSILFANNVVCTLVQACQAADTALVVDGTNGPLLPQPVNPGDYFLVTLQDNTQNPVAREIVKCTARTGSTLTVVRGQESTSAQPFAAQTTTVSNRLTAGTLATIQGQATTAAANSSQALSANVGNAGRNHVVNGLFSVQQRGTGPFTGNQVTADQWWSTFTGGGASQSVTLASLTDVDRAQIGLEFLASAAQIAFTGDTGAVSYNALEQHLEAVRALSGQTVTVSFYAKSLSGNQPLYVSLSQVFGTGGSPSAAVFIPGAAFTIIGSWQRYSFTVAIPSAAGKTTGTNFDSYTDLQFLLSGGASTAFAATGSGPQSGTVWITGVQLEGGTVASALEQAPYDWMLARCFRYYTTFAVFVRGQATGVQPFDSPVYYRLMRASPTITLAAVGTSLNLSGGAVAILNISATGARAEITSAAAGDTYAVGYVFAASAEI